MLRKFFVAIPITVLCIGGSTACATKKFVRTSVGEVNEKVDSQGRAIEETQERTRRNEGRISEVDQKAGGGRPEGGGSGQAAAAAHTAANAANTLGTEANTKVRHDRPGQQAAGLRSRPERRPGQLQVRQDDSAGRSQARRSTRWWRRSSRIRRTSISRSRATPTTSAPPKTNEQIGLARAEAVKRYLYEQYQIPLHKMNVISYGKDKPVAPNKTRDGRAQNRRVVIKVLA